MPQMTTLHGKLLRSSDMTQATIVKTMIPDAEIKFCMRGSEPQPAALWEDLTWVERLERRSAKRKRIPLLARGGEAAASIRSREATAAPQTGWREAQAR